MKEKVKSRVEVRERKWEEKRESGMRKGKKSEKTRMRKYCLEKN